MTNETNQDTKGQSQQPPQAGQQSQSDTLTKPRDDFDPEGQGASNAGGSDIETGQSTNIDATLDDGADTSQ